MTTDKHRFKKEMEASQYFMNKNAKSMFDVIDMCKYYCKSEEKAVRQTNSEREEGSFVKLLNQEMEELTKNMKKENKRYLNCKYLDAGMDGMLCSKSLCTTCKEFKGEKCKDYTPENKIKDKETKTGTIRIVPLPEPQYATSCLICGQTVRIYNHPIIDVCVCDDCKKAIEYIKEKMQNER